MILMWCIHGCCPQGPPYILDGAFTLFFALYCGVFFGASQHQAAMTKWVMLVMHAWLAAVMLVSTWVLIQAAYVRCAVF